MGVRAIAALSQSCIAAVLARFDREMRIDPPSEPGAYYADAVTVVGRFMVCDLAEDTQRLQAPPRSGVELVAVDDDVRLADLVMVTTQAFDADKSWMLDALPPLLFGSDPCAAACVAYAEHKPVGVGRIEYGRGRSFASLWGGATIRAYRRRGIFAAIVRRRVEEARRAGYRYVTVDARQTSRPVLERLGFSVLTTVVGWNLHQRRRTRDCMTNNANTIEPDSV